MKNKVLPKWLRPEPEGELLLMGLLLAVEACERLGRLPEHDCGEPDEDHSCAACDLRDEAAGQSHTLRIFCDLAECNLSWNRGRQWAREALARLGFDARLADDRDGGADWIAALTEPAPEDAPEPVLAPAHP